MSYNVKLLALIASAIVFVVGFATSTTAVTVIGAVGFVGMFFFTFRHMKQIEAADRAVIEARYAELKSSLATTQALAISKLGTADAMLVASVNEKLADAASHLSSNPAWSNTRRIITSADVIAWYEAGIAKVGEAKKMIDDFAGASQK